MTSRKKSSLDRATLQHVLDEVRRLEAEAEDIAASTDTQPLAEEAFDAVTTLLNDMLTGLHGNADRREGPR